LGIRAGDLEEVCRRANRTDEAHHQARHYVALDAAVRAMQRLLELRADLQRRLERIGPKMAWEGSAVASDCWSQAEALLGLGRLTHDEVLECLGTCVDALPQALAQRIDRVARNVKSLSRSLPDLPKNGAPQRGGENYFIRAMARLCRQAAGHPYDALCCDLYKLVFGYRVFAETTYKARRLRVESAAR
jgi:hypothetical protein